MIHLMIFNESEEQERVYLRQIIALLKRAIKDIDSSVKEQEQALREHKDYLWQSRTDIDAQEVRSMRESILNTLAVGEGIIARRRRLGKLLNIPYFGRIDFCEDGSKYVQPIYIGVHTYYDSETKSNLIYDWRAPIAGMYYDYELGEASFISPSGEVSGNSSLKRQYRIRNGEMEYMIESSVTVHDDILQRELSASTDDKMKNIVATIQREQNRIIRNEDSSVLIIQGVAGSGKTSIALHRVAYLLYTHKGTLASKDILIISPNKVFADYISNVLPELGEETVPEISMEQLLSDVLERKYKFQTFFGQVAELLGKPQPGFIDRIRYKSTFDFIIRLDRFILYVENNYFRPVDVKVKHITIPHEYLAEEFRRFHRYPVRQRFDVMTEHILETLVRQYQVEITTADRNMLKKQVRKMFTGNNDLQLYKDFFQWAEVPEMFKLRKGHVLEYADLAPLAYLRISLDGLKPRSEVKHLLVDEMQDYSPVQYKVLSKLFPCRKTILGDAGQSVNPYGSSTADMIAQAFVTGKVMKLCKSYRSSFEITRLAQKIRSNADLEPVARHGEEPSLIPFANQEEEISGIVDLLHSFRKSAYKSLGIICKDEVQAQEVNRKLLEAGEDIYFLSSDSLTFHQGVVITSAHMAKGLEFDEVIIPQASEVNYRTEIDRSMLYVAVTRAMHRLSLTYTGELTSLISG